MAARLWLSTSLRPGGRASAGDVLLAHVGALIASEARCGPHPRIGKLSRVSRSGPCWRACPRVITSPSMCGRVIQSSGPLRYAIVDGMNVRDSRVHNYPPRWNAAPSQELLVIRRNHKTGEVTLDPLRWGLIPYWCKDPSGGRK